MENQKLIQRHDQARIGFTFTQLAFCACVAAPFDYTMKMNAMLPGTGDRYELIQFLLIYTFIRTHHKLYFNMDI